MSAWGRGSCSIQFFWYINAYLWKICSRNFKKRCGGEAVKGSSDFFLRILFIFGWKISGAGFADDSFHVWYIQADEVQGGVATVLPDNLIFDLHLSLLLSLLHQGQPTFNHNLSDRCVWLFSFKQSSCLNVSLFHMLVFFPVYGWQLSRKSCQKDTNEFYPPIVQSKSLESIHNPGTLFFQETMHACSQIFFVNYGCGREKKKTRFQLKNIPFRKQIAKW